MRSLLVVATLLCPAASAAEFRDVGFMSGCWRTAPEISPEVRECYTAPKAGLMQGSSQTIKDGKTTFFEFSLVMAEGEKIIYRPFLKGQPAAVDFVLVKLSPTEAVFENLAHDFPQRIIYRKTGEKLTARVEDAAGAKADEWVMQRQ